MNKVSGNAITILRLYKNTAFLRVFTSISLLWIANKFY